MSQPRTITAKLFDFTSDARLIIYGQDGEHLVVKMDYAQVANLDYSLSKYADYYKPEKIA